MSARRLGTAVVFTLLVLGCRTARAHELRPAYLELREVAPETYDVLWKVPARDDRRLALDLAFPEGCGLTTPPRATIAAGAYVERSRVACPHGLAGGAIRIDGLPATLTDVLARVERADGSAQVARLTSDRPAFVVEAAPDAWDVARTYLPLGIEHILTGIDHLLFVLGLLLLVRGAGQLVKTVSAFTVAHALTLTLATLGVVHVPSAPVEAVIALSIVLVAREALEVGRGVAGLAQRRPWLVALAFGLLHGLGFAGGLTEVGLPVTHVPLALLLFSVGVEIGHFAFVAAALAVGAGLRRLWVAPPAWTHAVPAYAIGAVATCWVIERVGAFW